MGNKIRIVVEGGEVEIDEDILEELERAVCKIENSVSKFSVKVKNIEMRWS